MTELWSDPDVKKTIEMMDPKVRYVYSKMGKHILPNRIDDPDAVLLEAAAQVRLMLSDGLAPEDLEENEKYVLIAAYGADKVEQDLNISLPYENECSATDYGLSSDFD